jgi:Icc-related predicted phosphoesterase
MKVVFTSDLHGERRLYHELLDLARSSSADLMALGGDLLPSFAPTKRYEDMIPYQESFIEAFLVSFFQTVIRETRVRQIFLIPGNWDLGYPHLLGQPVEGMVDLDQKNVRLENGYDLIGYPCVPPTPFRPKDYEKMDDLDSPWPPQKDLSYIRSDEEPGKLMVIDPHVYLRRRTTIQEDLDRLPDPPSFNRAIYVMHSPPYGTSLDLIHGGGRAGSRSIRAFIQENQPSLTLHGHIHESPQLSGSYVERIGETISVNPGQGYWAGGDRRLHAVIFEMERIGETLSHTCFRRS